MERAEMRQGNGSDDKQKQGEAQMKKASAWPKTEGEKWGREQSCENQIKIK